MTAFIDSFSVVSPTTKLRIVAADPADNRVLEAAIAAGADYVVTGDHHLLNLKAIGDIPIVMPARFLAILGAEHESE